MSFNWSQHQGACRVIAANEHEDWCVNAQQEIYHRRNGGGWERIPGAAVYIDVGRDGACWCINSADEIYRWNGGGWDRIPGAARTIGVGSARDGTFELFALLILSLGHQRSAGDLPLPWRRKLATN